jgi:hypothetical protein
MLRSGTWLIASSLIVLPLSASAQSPPPHAAAEDPALGEAKVHFQQGVALFNDGNFNAALAEFEAAYKIRRSPGVLYNIGLTQKALFRYSEAIASLEKYKAEETKITPERRAEVDQLIVEMRALLADVTMNIEPQGASVLVDGRTMGQAPLGKPLGIAAGSHVVEVVLDGYKPARKELMVSAGVPLTLNFKLELIPKTGKVRVTTMPLLASVKIDNKDLGPAPIDAELALGGHTLEVTAPKFLLHRSELVVAAGQLRTVDVVLDPVPKSKVYTKWYFWTPLILGLAGVGVGLGLGLSREGPLVGTLGTGVGQVN